MKVHARRMINCTIIEEEIIMYTQRRLGLWRLSHAVLILNYQLDWMIILISHNNVETTSAMAIGVQLYYSLEYSQFTCM